MSTHDAGELRFGHFELLPEARRLIVEGRLAKLGGRAFDVLTVLIDHRGRVVGKNELFDRVWPGLVVEENNLHVHIAALRKLLGPTVIVTIPGRGYQFVVPQSAGRPAASPANGQQALHVAPAVPPAVAGGGNGIATIEPGELWTLDAGPVVITARYRPRLIMRLALRGAIAASLMVTIASVSWWCLEPSGGAVQVARAFCAS